MKAKNLPDDYNSLSLEELTEKAHEMVEYLENQKDHKNTVENYQNLIKINNVIEKKFQKNNKDINENTKQKLLKIISKKNAK